MFNNDYTLIKKTKLILRLTTMKNKKGETTISALPECLKSSFFSLREKKGREQKKCQRIFSGYSYFEMQKVSKQEKNTVVNIVRNPTIDWHCSKPLGKNELGLWFNFITQPFSTRKHWWILLPAQNLVFRLKWERSQSSNLGASDITNITSLNWFSEKPVYFYVVIPFLGCLGLISGVYPETSDLVNRDFVSFGTSFRRRLNDTQRIQRNNEISYKETLPQDISNWMNYVQDRYVGIYSDSKSYLNYLNSSTLLKNLNREGFDPLTSISPVRFEKEKVGKRTDYVPPFLQADYFGNVLDIFNTRKFQDKSVNFDNPVSFSPSLSLWNKYLFNKSKIDWFWSKWAADLTRNVSKPTNLTFKNSRFIWEKLNGSSFYKLNSLEKSHSEWEKCQQTLFVGLSFSQNNFSLHKNRNSLVTDSRQIDYEMNEFAQKLFSTYGHFPRKMLINSNQTETRFNTTVAKSTKFRTFSSNQKINTLKYSPETLNFILISGVKKKLSKISPVLGRNSSLKSQKGQEHKKEFYDLFGLINLNKNSSFLMKSGTIVPELYQNKFLNGVTPVESFSKYFTTAFFLDNFFVEFSTNKKLNFLKPYFGLPYSKIIQTSSTTEKNLSPVNLSARLSLIETKETKFKKLNFPILLSGYANAKQIQFASPFKVAEQNEFSKLHNDLSPDSFTWMSSSQNWSQKSLDQNRFDFDPTLSLKKGPPLLSFPLITKFITNTTQNNAYSSSFKWRSVGNWSFYWNYFKHFYGVSGLLKPWSSTFESIVVHKPSKNFISNILLNNLSRPFKSVNIFPDQNFLFNKWHSKKKQGFFYKRITKLELKKRNLALLNIFKREKTSHSRVVSLLWGFRAKYKLDEVLQYQKSKYYQSKKAQQTAHQNLNQNTTSTNINNQLVMKTLTKRRRYKKYLEFNVLSSWLRDVLYFKKMGRKLVKIKKDTYLFNHSNINKNVQEGGLNSHSPSIGSQMKKQIRKLNQVGSFKTNLASQFLPSVNHSVSQRYSNQNAVSVKKKALEKERAILDRFKMGNSLQRNELNKLSFASFEFQSLNTSKNLGLLNIFKRETTLNKISRLNKVYPLNPYLNSSQVLPFQNQSDFRFWPGLNRFKTESGALEKEGIKLIGLNPFSVNKTPVFLKKIALNSSNKRFGVVRQNLNEKPYGKAGLVKLSLNQRNRNKFETQSLTKIFKHFNSFFYSFQTKIFNKLFSKSSVSHSLKQIKPRYTSFETSSSDFFRSKTKKQPNFRLFAQKNIFSNKQKFISSKVFSFRPSLNEPKQNTLKFNKMVILHGSKKQLRPVFFDPKSKKSGWLTHSLSQNPTTSLLFKFSYLSSKLKTNINTSLLKKVSNFSSTLYKPLHLSSPFCFAKQEFSQNQKRSVQPFISVQDKSSTSLDELSFRFKNLSSSFVIWRNKFQIRRDYLLLSYIYLDYLGTIINSLKGSSNFLNFAQVKQDQIRPNWFGLFFSEGFVSDFELKSNYFVESERYKTNLIKPFWSFSIINHLKNNHIGVYEQLLNSSTEQKNSILNYSQRFDSTKGSDGIKNSSDISNIPVLPEKSISSFINFGNKNSSVLFNRSIKSSNKFFSSFLTSGPTPLGTPFFSFSDSTTFNKNYLNYKTNRFNQKIILLKKQKLISSFSKGLKQIKIRGTTKQSIQWTKLKYRRKSGIYKTRLVNKETKIYNGILFQNLGINLEHSNHSVSSSQESSMLSVKNITFWLCTVLFHICLVSSLITTYKVSFHFCLKTLYSSIFILNKYFVYAQYRIQRLISYIYRNNFENFIETLDTAAFKLKKQSFSIGNNLNFALKACHYSYFLSPIFQRLNIHKISQISLTKNPFTKLFFLPYSYASKRKNNKELIFLSQSNNNANLSPNSLNRFKLKMLTLLQYIQAKYETPFSNLQLNSKQLDESFDQSTEKDGGSPIFSVPRTKKMGESPSFASPFKSSLIEVVDLKDLQGDSNFQVHGSNINKDIVNLGYLGNLQTNEKIRFAQQTNNTSKDRRDVVLSPDFFVSVKPSLTEVAKLKKRGRSKAESSEKPMGLGLFKSTNQTNIKLYFKVLKWNMLLTLLIGESEVLAELEPYREMHWYFLKKFPIFLRTSSTKDYLSMSDYQADEKIRIIKQKIRQTIMILYLRTKNYESKLQNRSERVSKSQNEKNTNQLVRNRLNQKKLSSKDKLQSNSKNSLVDKSKFFGFMKPEKKESKLDLSRKDNLGERSLFSKEATAVKRSLTTPKRKIKKLSFWKSLLTFLGKYSFLSRSAILSKRFRESLMMFSYPFVPFGPIGTIFLTFGLKKFILDFDQSTSKASTFSHFSVKSDWQPQFNYLEPRVHKEQSNIGIPSQNMELSSLADKWKRQNFTEESNRLGLSMKEGGLETTHLSSFLRGSKPNNSIADPELEKLNSYIFQKITKKDLVKNQTEVHSLFDLEFFTDVEKFVKKYNRVYFSVTNTLNKTNVLGSKSSSLNFSNHYKKILMNSLMQSTISSKDIQTLKLNNFYDWSYTEKSNQLGKNSIYSDTFDPKLRYYRFSTNFSKVLSDVGGFYTNIAAHHELGPLICKVYTGAFSKQSAKNYLLVSGSTNHESVLLLIQALSAEMGMKLFMEDAKRLQRIGRRGINKATKRLEKLFDIAQANSPALVFIEDIHVIGAKTKMVKVDEEQDDIEILSRSLLSKLVYRKYHKNKSLRESFIDQNLFTGGSASTRRRSLKPSNPIPTSLVLYQLTRRKALSNFFKSQENQARRLNNKLFLSKKLSPAFTTNAVLIWKLFKSKIATPNKRIKEAPWYHIPVDAMRSINPLTYSIRVKVAKITLLAIFTMGTRLRLVKDLIRLFEKIQFESYQNFIVFATTNKLSTLDPNLRRPGRLEETISLEGLTGSPSSSRSPAFMTVLDTFKVHLKNVPGFSKTFNVIDNTLFSTNLNLQEWTVINYLAENAYYSLDSFKHNSSVTNFTPIDFGTDIYNNSTKASKYILFSEISQYQNSKTVLPTFSTSIKKLNITATRKENAAGFLVIGDQKFPELRFSPLKATLLSQSQRMTSFSTKNQINSPFSLFSNQNSGSHSTSSYWQSLFSNIIVQRKTGLFTFNYSQKTTHKLEISPIRDFYKIDKFNLFLIFAYSRSGQSLISFLLGESQGRIEQTKLLPTFSKKQASSLMFDSDYLMNLQLWPELVNQMSLKKSNIFSKRRQNLHSSFLKFFASKVGEVIFLNSVIWTTPTTRASSNTKNSFHSVQNRFTTYSNSGLHNIYNTTSAWTGAYASIKNVVTTSALYSKTPLLSKLLRLEDVSKPRQKQFFESLNAGMLFEYSDFHYRAFFKKNNLSTEENLNLLIYQKYMLNNQGRPLRKYVKLEHSNRLWLFRILYTELGSLDNITLNPTSMNYYYRNKIALKQVFKLSSYQWWNWHLRKPLEQLEDIQEIAYFPCENKYYTPRRRRWMLTNGFWGYWFSFDKNFYFDLYQQYMLQSLHFACLQLDKNREVLDYLAKLYIYKEKLSETDIIFALKRYQI